MRPFTDDVKSKLAGLVHSFDFVAACGAHRPDAPYDTTRATAIYKGCRINVSGGFTSVCLVAWDIHYLLGYPVMVYGVDASQDGEPDQQMKVIANLGDWTDNGLPLKQHLSKGE